MRCWCECVRGEGESETARRHDSGEVARWRGGEVARSPGHQVAKK
jgi:hypothetical protein